MKKKLTIGILAHVDAGKTTLSEALLYVSGKIRKLGRVDRGDTYLDTYSLERERGITIKGRRNRLPIILEAACLHEDFLSNSASDASFTSISESNF